MKIYLFSPSFFNNFINFNAGQILCRNYIKVYESILYVRKCISKVNMGINLVQINPLYY